MAAGQIGILRRLLRSIGMGGTASPLSWGVAYDPIVEGMFRAIGIEATTYVDDLAGLINGPAQAMRASYGRFPKIHSVFLGRDLGTLKSDIVSKNIHN